MTCWMASPGRIDPTVGTWDRCGIPLSDTWRVPVASRGGLLPARKEEKGKQETLQGSLGGARGRSGSSECSFHVGF